MIIQSNRDTVVSGRHIAFEFLVAWFYLLMALLVSPSLCWRQKYLNNQWIDVCETFYRCLACQDNRV